MHHGEEEMTKDITIKIKGKQTYPGGECVETVTETAGEYYMRNGSHYVMYEEQEAGFTQSSKCMLKVYTQGVELTKKGLLQSKMVFEEGKQHMTEYRTPFGVFMLEVQTGRVSVLEEENSLTVRLEYSLGNNEEPMADCDITITVTSKE